MIGSIDLSDREYKLISDLVYRTVGIHLDEHKKALIVGRLQKFLREKEFSNFSQYYDYVNSDPTGQALKTLVTNISTNYTFFFRENDHFTFFLKNVLPQITEMLKKYKSRDLRIWCAGCSSGEEPYTLAILLLEYFGSEIKSWETGVLATDISEKALEKANNGIYSDENISGIPLPLRNKYFSRHDEKNWIVENQVKKLVLFRRFNLMRESFPFKKKFHVIFCRNVMIYFDKPTQNKLVRRFYSNTEPGGYLFIGHSETLPRGDCSYDFIKPAVYRRN